MWDLIEIYEGRIIILLMLIIILREGYKIYSRWGKAPPVTFFEMLSILDDLSLSNKDAQRVVQKLLDENNLDLKNFITEDNRRQEKRNWDESFNEKRKNNE